MEIGKIIKIEVLEPEYIPIELPIPEPIPAEPVPDKPESVPVECPDMEVLNACI